MVRAPPRVLPRSLAPCGVLGGGGGWPGPFPALPGSGLCVPRGADPWHSCAGGRVGGGGGPCAVPPVCAARGASRAGGCSASFRPTAFPGQATKRLSLASFWSWGAWPPYRSGLCSPAFSGRDLCGVLARWHGLACSPRFLWEPAAGAGGRAVLRLLSRAGGGGTIPPASGEWGPASPRLAGRWGGWGGGGGSRRDLPAPPVGGSPWLPTLAPLLSSAHSPPGVRLWSGLRGRPGGGGDEGRPVDRSPGGPFRPEPSLCPPRVGNGHGGGSRGARPPYCSGAPPCAAPRLGPRAALARWSGLARRPRPPRDQAAGGAGARGVQVQPHPPPPPASRSLLGEGGRPLGSGGAEGRSCGPQVGGGSRGGGTGGPLRCPLPPRPVGRRPAIRCLQRAPPGYTRAVGVAGRPWASGAARSAANGSVRRGGEGGGENPPAQVRAPAFPRPASEWAAAFAPSWAPPVRRRSAVGRAGACGRFTGGACRGRGAPSTRVQRPLRGGCGAAFSSVCPRPLLGLRGRGGGSGGGPLVPWCRPLMADGGRPGGPGPGGQPSAGGSHSSPDPPNYSWTLVQALAGVPCPPRRRRAALAGRGRP